MFSTIHHAVEEHHHENEECSAAETGETHLHGWEFEDCNLCDLHSNTNSNNTKVEYFTFINTITKPYYISYVDGLTSQEILSYSNKGPPTV